MLASVAVPSPGVLAALGGLRRSRPVRTLVRLRLPMLLLALVVQTANGTDVGDLQLFLRDGLRLFGHWSQAFSDPSLQTGPLTLLFDGLVGRTARAVGLAAVPAVRLVTAVLCTGVTLVALRRARVAAGLLPSAECEAAVMGLLVLLDLPGAAAAAGHPAELLVPALWLLAAAEARSDRAWRGGLLLAAAAGAETWGLLGLPVLLLSPDFRKWRRCASGVVAAAALSGALWLPFALTGGVASGRLVWHVGAVSPLAPLIGIGAPFGWGARLLQATLVIGVGSVLALRSRDDPAALWAVPLALAACRLLLDPLCLDYYFVVPQTLVVLGLGIGPLRRGWPALAGGWLLGIGLDAGVTVSALLSLAGAAATLMPHRTSRDGSVAEPPQRRE